MLNSICQHSHRIYIPKPVISCYQGSVFVTVPTCTWTSGKLLRVERIKLYCPGTSSCSLLVARVPTSSIMLCLEKKQAVHTHQAKSGPSKHDGNEAEYGFAPETGRNRKTRKATEAGELGRTETNNDYIILTTHTASPCMSVHRSFWKAQLSRTLNVAVWNASWHVRNTHDNQTLQRERIHTIHTNARAILQVQ